jgi:hypothetical protein
MAGTGFGGGFGAETGAGSGSCGSDDLGPSLSFSTGFLAFTCVSVMLCLGFDNLGIVHYGLRPAMHFRQFVADNGVVMAGWGGLWGGLLV